MRWRDIHLTYSDGYQGFARLAEPLDCLGGVLYLHGIQSHSGWFLESARRLAEAGLCVLMPDRRGSGRNREARGDAPSAERLIRDVCEAASHLRKIVPSIAPIHLLGVSWGGKLALAAVMHLPSRPASVVLVAPGLFPRVGLTVRERLLAAMSLFGRNARLPIPLDDPALFTADPAWQGFIRQDPERLREVTGRFCLASRRLDALARRACPGCGVHLFLAGRDRIIDTEQTARWARRALGDVAHLHMFPDAEHTLEFEPCREQYFALLGSVLRRGAGSGTGGG